MTRPDGKPETLGLVVLDEPMAKQSDPTGKVCMICDVFHWANETKIPFSFFRVCSNSLASVVQTMDSAIRRINHYPVDR